MLMLLLHMKYTNKIKHDFTMKNTTKCVIKSSRVNVMSNSNSTERLEAQFELDRA